MATYESVRYQFTGANIDSASIPSPTIANGSVTNTEFQTVDATSSIQTQLNSKFGATGGTFTGDITLADNVDLNLGNGNDMIFTSDGSTGFIKGNTITIEDASGNDMATYVANGAAKLFFGGAQKLESTNTGVTVAGTMAAGALQGDGTNITALAAANITSGGTLPALVGTALTSVNAANLIGTYAALNGGSITSINASNVASGTLANARLPSSISVSNVAGNGSGLTSLNASNLSSGTVAAARLPGGLGKVLQMQVFTNQSQFSTTSNIPADGSTPTISEGIQVASRTFTPTASNSQLIHVLNVFTGGNSGEALSSFSIFRGNTNIGSFADITGDSGHFKTVMGQTVESSAATTSQITYTIRFGTQSNTVYWNRASGTNGFTGTNPNNSSLRWIIYEIGA